MKNFLFILDKLLAILDEKQAPEFAEKLFNVWDDYKNSSKTHRTKKRKVLQRHSLTHLSRMEFPILINWTCPFPF